MSNTTNAAFETLMRFYEAETIYLSPSGGDFGIIAETLDAECVLHQPGSLPYGGEWRGPDGFKGWMEAFGRQWSSLEVKNPQFYPSGEDVIFSRSHVYAVSRPTGREVDWPLLQFFRVRNNRILELRPFHWDTAAMLPAMRATREDTHAQ
ncbi:nuclear transport factor 2 family protein [Mesorhizobium sp. M4B.F.Ca.ET.169.01.1.1]|uniref:nuclear transport factor 2 family protein n=1 Tax=unclassified Mesorhizobium TaxID=325217 RepID=UPI000FCB07D4|nr:MULTISPECIES: nuclear transport factor 2 family protein [unclassified Mesorhizobium]RVD41882.1 nuclear transport factor 2 family protein [Mesorhizobium sp. M4B.F.Ca.ET.019.03.1.1]RWX71248.1 nuclear transport factor 2 family protein [Mesorhizobium sp. M2A.F.Ca.ET.039.01.1.1]TGT41883.1 nuclear transport factor 2 family protein [Mesorhizobium sp. M4B.F.Ca.ET.169.01.1.1]TIU72392.1 MAG: nuclear transport factor 2 family protein [Mesorhizobium sp.]TIV47783.1 MAG: nuclear transport factor 2 family